MQSREIFFSSSLFAEFRFELLILVLCITSGMLRVANAQAPDNNAITRLLPGATAGRIRSQVDLANAYLKTNRPEDIQQAIHWYRVAANSGDPLAQTELGMMLEGGLGTAADLIQAREWYRLAAADGYPPAMVLLASLYSQGKGIAQDREEAFRLLQRAAEQGYAPAKTDLAVLYLFGADAPGHDVDAVRLLRKAAGRDPKAAFVLGWCYQEERGVKRDLAGAAHWYTKAANQGFAGAENNLGLLYETGGGVPADSAAALSWYRRAAEHGMPDAALSVAKLMLVGPEQVRDPNAALVCFAIARRIGARGAESEAGLNRLMQEASATERQAIDNAAARWLARHQPNNRTASFDTAQLSTSDRDDK
jgi:TPR repeat protein